MTASAAAVFLGSELAAQGFRLAGVRVATPSLGEELTQFRAVCAEAAVVLLAAECASRLPVEVLEAALLGTRPLVYVLPETLGAETRGAAQKARRVLGIES